MPWQRSREVVSFKLSFSDNGDALFDAIYYVETVSKNEQPDISTQAGIPIATGDRSYGYSGAEDFVLLADYNSRLLILIDGYRYNDNRFGSSYVDQSFLIHVDVIGQADILSCHRFQMNDDITTYDKPDLISSLWTFSVQEEFSVNKSQPNNVSILFDFFSPFSTTVKPWLGFMYNPFGKSALKLLNKTSFKSTSAIKLNYAVLTTLANPDLRPEKRVKAKKCTNGKTGYISNSAISNLTLFNQNSIKGFELFAGGYNLGDKLYFEQRSDAHRQSTAQQHSLMFKIKYGIDF
jgi:hypothetical protein